MERKGLAQQFLSILLLTAGTTAISSEVTGIEFREIDYARNGCHAEGADHACGAFAGDSNDYWGDNSAKIYRGTYEARGYNSRMTSYQGTSTGPGPNGGYPGTPRGVYPIDGDRGAPAVRSTGVGTVGNWDNVNRRH